MKSSLHHACWVLMWAEILPRKNQRSSWPRSAKREHRWCLHFKVPAFRLQRQWRFAHCHRPLAPHKSLQWSRNKFNPITSQNSNKRSLCAKNRSTTNQSKKKHRSMNRIHSQVWAFLRWTLATTRTPSGGVAIMRPAITHQPIGNPSIVKIY